MTTRVEFDSSKRKTIRRLVKEQAQKNLPAITLAGVDLDPDGDGLVEALGTYADLADRYRPYTAVSANASIDDATEVVGADSSGGAITVTLDAALHAPGRVITVTDVGGSSSLNAITVATSGTSTVDGATSGSVAADYGQLRLVSDGTNWFSI